MSQFEVVWSKLNDEERSALTKVLEEARDKGLNMIKTQFENLNTDLLDVEMGTLAEAVSAGDKKAEFDCIKAIEFGLMSLKKKRSKEFIINIVEEIGRIAIKAIPIIVTALLRR